MLSLEPGLLFQIAATIGAVAVGYGTMRGQIMALQAQIVAIKELMQALKDTMEKESRRADDKSIA
jgi:hypothetical protein